MRNDNMTIEYVYNNPEHVQINTHYKCVYVYVYIYICVYVCVYIIRSPIFLLKSVKSVELIHSSWSFFSLIFLGFCMLQ